MRDMSNTRKQIAARLGMVARPGAKAEMDKSAALAIIGKAIADVPAGAQRDALQKALIDYYDNTQASNRLLKQGNTKDANRFAVEAGRAAQIAVRTWDRMGKPAAELRGFTQNLERAAEFARPGAKAKMAASISKHGHKVRAGIMDRIGAAASALTASPADPTSPQYRQQLAAAKKTAQDAVGNYKFMRDKVKGRQDAMDKYVGAAIKTINASTNVQDVEHFAEQIQIAVRALSTMLSSVKTPFARKENKTDVLYGEYAKLQEYVSGVWNVANNYVYDMWSMLDLRKSAKGIALYEEMKKLAGQLALMERQLSQVDPYSVAGLKKGIELGNKLANQASPLLSRAKDLYQQFRRVIKAPRPGAKAKGTASRSGAKAAAAKTTMAAPTPHKVTIVDKTGTERSYMVSDRVLRSIEGTKKQAEARGTKPAYDDVIRLGTKMGEVMEAAKPSDLEREDVKAGLKLMAASDEAVSNKIRTLIAEGKPQDQAVAIALDMKRRGEI